MRNRKIVPWPQILGPSEVLMLMQRNQSLHRASRLEQQNLLLRLQNSANMSSWNFLESHHLRMWSLCLNSWMPRSLSLVSCKMQVRMSIHHKFRRRLSTPLSNWRVRLKLLPVHRLRCKQLLEPQYLHLRLQTWPGHLSTRYRSRYGMLWMHR